MSRFLRENELDATDGKWGPDPSAFSYDQELNGI